MQLEKDLVESFCLEIISNSQKVVEDTTYLLTYNFSSNSSIKVLQVIQDISHAIEIGTQNIYKEIDWEDKRLVESKFRLLRRIKDMMQDIASHLQYIENSTMEKVPWNIVESFQEIASTIIPNAKIILYQQWKYNYSIITKNLFSHYDKSINALKGKITDKDFKSIKTKLAEPLYLISFPYLEKNNILLYSLLGHEIGHLAADKLLKKMHPSYFYQDTIQKLEEFYTQEKYNISFANYFKKCKIIWERLYVELTSDAVGSLIFGQAMLFSMFEFSMQQNMNDVPNDYNDYYPPWKTRLRVVFETICSYLPIFNKNEFNIFSDQNFNKRLEIIRTIITDKTDIQNIQKEKYIMLIYTDVLKRIKEQSKQLVKEFNKDNFSETHFIEKINELNKRLTDGLPPNTTDDLDQTKISSLSEIINAAWINRLSWEANIFSSNGTFKANYIEQRNKLNTLTLKAIEYINLSNRYMDKDSSS